MLFKIHIFKSGWVCIVLSLIICMDLKSIYHSYRASLLTHRNITSIFFCIFINLVCKHFLSVKPKKKCCSSFILARPKFYFYSNTITFIPLRFPYPPLPFYSLPSLSLSLLLSIVFPSLTL